MKCVEKESELQRTRSDPGETLEEPSQESPHRAQSLHKEEPSNPCRIVPQKWTKWPPANSQTLWLQFDEDVSKILQTTAKGEADHWLEAMTAIIVSYASERFSYVQTRSAYTMNCRDSCGKSFDSRNNSTRWLAKRKSNHLLS